VKTITRFLIGVLLSGWMIGNVCAESAGEGDAAEVRALIETMKVDTAELRLLSEELPGAEQMDKQALMFRLDKRSLRLLTDFDLLISKLTDLPEGSPLRKEIEATSSEIAASLDDAIFSRIDGIRLRIIAADAELGNLSGGSLIAVVAYIQSMEALQVAYYEALANHLDSRKVLGLSTENLLNRLVPKLQLYAETIAGRIEANDAISRKAQQLSESDPENADIKTTLNGLVASHGLNVSRLEAIIVILDRLGLKSADYKAVMLQQSRNLSFSFISGEAVILVVKDKLTSLKGVFKENAADMVFNLIMFVSVIFLFQIFSRIIKRLVRAACDHSSLDLSNLLKDILVSTSGGIIMAVGLLIALSQVGISIAPMLAGLGVAGFIIGFALQDILGNFASGAMILIYRPFDVDDFIEVTGAAGLVKKMNLVSTTIATYDNEILVVPNSKIWGSVIKNVTAQKVRRVDLEFGVGYSEDIEKTERVLENILVNHEMVLKNPKPMIKLNTLGDSSVNFAVRPWVKTEDYWDVYWDITREVKIRFDQEGISIPFPQRDVHFYNEHA